MSQEAIESVLTHSQAKGSDRLLLLTIAHHVEVEGRRCQVSKVVLSHETGISHGRLRRMLRFLEKMNELRVNIGGGCVANSYSISLPTHKPQQAPATRRYSSSHKIRSSSRYGEWRGAVLHRDQRACKQCGETNDLRAHHIKPFAKFPDSRFEVNNGITLCESCHSKIAGSELEHELAPLELLQ